MVALSIVIEAFYIFWDTRATYFLTLRGGHASIWTIHWDACTWATHVSYFTLLAFFKEFDRAFWGNNPLFWHLLTHVGFIEASLEHFKGTTLFGMDLHMWSLMDHFEDIPLHLVGSTSLRRVFVMIWPYLLYYLRRVSTFLDHLFYWDCTCGISPP